MNTHRIEADVYRKLHERREDHIELARRAREYQSELAHLNDTSFTLSDRTILVACVASWVSAGVIAAVSISYGW